MNTYPAIIQMSLQSKRLPRKVLADLGGEPLWWWSVRAALESPAVSQVIIDLPNNQADDEFFQHLTNSLLLKEAAKRVVIVRPAPKLPRPDLGFLLDWMDATGYLQGKWVFRITADCPFVDPQDFTDLSTMQSHHPLKEHIYTTHTDQTPTGRTPGSDIELFPVRPLRLWVLEALYRQLPHASLDMGYESPPELTFMVDTLADLLWARYIVKALPRPTETLIVPWYMGLKASARLGGAL